MGQGFISNNIVGGETPPDASTTIKGVTKLSVAPVSPTDPIAVGDNDSRNTNARTPTAHASTHTNGTDDIQNATVAQKGLLTAADWAAFNGKQAALGFTPEDVANKQTDLTASATKYPTVNAVNTGLGTKQPAATGTPDGTKFLRDDNSWQALPASGLTQPQVLARTMGS
jgi:hypothetical protein